jgi:hypothetical protein
MTESELREQVAKKLRRDDVPEELWQDLVERRFIQGALQGEESISDVVKEVKRELRLTQQLANRKSPPGRKAHVVTPPSLQAQEWDRAQTLAEWLGHHVAAMPRVRQLREKLFAGGTLSADQAMTVLQSPALRFLSWDRCMALGIPLVGHEARIVTEQDEVTPTHRFIDVTLSITWTGGSFLGEFHWEEEHHGRGTQLEYIMLPRWRLVEVWPESVLAELHKCSAWLAYRYPWEERDAFWFVLTGEYPRVSPVVLCQDHKEHRDLYRHRIILYVDPWVSAKTVGRAYRAAQDRVLVGRDNRPLCARNLALVRFVAARRDAHGESPRWKDLLEEWNQTCNPEWTYDRISTFAKAVGRAEMTLRFPPYQGTQGPGDKRPLPNAELVGQGPIPLAEEAPFFWQRQSESAG